jgi:hypothetical protein
MRSESQAGNSPPSMANFKNKRSCDSIPACLHTLQRDKFNFNPNIKYVSDLVLVTSCTTCKMLTVVAMQTKMSSDECDEGPENPVCNSFVQPRRPHLGECHHNERHLHTLGSSIDSLHSVLIDDPLQTQICCAQKGTM